jgi:membrane protein DedA with SNARE-associated domain
VKREPGQRIPLPWLLTPVVVSSIFGWAGDILGPKLIDEHPLWVIAMNPRNRWLLLATTQVDALGFYVVGFLRLVATDPIAFLLGAHYGDSAVGWAERQMGDEFGMIRRVQRWFGKIAPLVILVMPSFYWCVLAGAARMRLRTFVALNVIGTIGRLVLFRLAGHAFRRQLEDALELVQRYQWWLVGLSLLFVVVSVVRRGGVETPQEMAEEIEEIEEASSD